MSVLSRLFSDVVRRPSGDEKVQEAKVQGTAPARVASAGMRVVILNWNIGENDPFTVVNATLRQHFLACGKNVEIVQITDNDWPERLARLQAGGGIEFAYTWQGLGSAVTVGEAGESLWDRLRIPLICIHADHPSHMPRNHQLESRYCFHLYTNAEFARYSNRHFRRIRSAGVVDFPQLFREPRLQRETGEYFVIAKNIDHPADIENLWRQRLDKRLFDVYMMAAETVKARIAAEPYIDIHDAFDDLLVSHAGWLNAQDNWTAFHEYHCQLDFYIRNHKSVAALTEARDFPVRIYGRGWDRLAKDAPGHHIFGPGRNMADSQELFYSRYGLIDISPSKGLHDRTRRAMVNGRGFLSSANLEDSLTDIGRFDPAFFDFRPSGLAQKCAAVVRDPEGHRECAREFANVYHDRFHFRDFVARLDVLAKVAAGV